MRSSGGPVTPGVRLGVTLRPLAGGWAFDCIAVFKETLEAIITVLGMPGVPLSDARRLRELADGIRVDVLTVTGHHLEYYYHSTPPSTRVVPA